MFKKLRFYLKRINKHYKTTKMAVGILVSYVATLVLLLITNGSLVSIGLLSVAIFAFIFAIPMSFSVENGAYINKVNNAKANRKAVNQTRKVNPEHAALMARLYKHSKI